MASVEGLIFLFAFGMAGWLWLALLLAVRKNTGNQRQHLGVLGEGKLGDMRHQLVAQIGADRVAVAMRAYII